MTRVCFTVLILLFTSIFITITSAQKKANSEATIKGEVIDTSPEQNPISKVKVKVVNAAQDKEYQTHTNKDGEYEITGLPAGRYTVSVSKDGYGDRVGKPKVVAVGGEIFDRIRMQKKGNILYKDLTSEQKKADSGATMKGEVIDTSPAQNPISKVNVKVVNAAQDKEYQTHTNKDGEYEITGLPAGRYTVSVSKDGYGDRVGKPKVVAVGGEIFDRIRMQKKGNILYKDLTSEQKKADSGATMKGEVIDTSPAQNPISKVNVKIVNRVNNKEYSTHTNKDGEFQIIGLPVGDYIIIATKDRYVDRVFNSKVVDEGGEVFHSIRMQKKKVNILTLYKDILVACVLSYILFFNPLSSSG